MYVLGIRPEGRGYKDCTDKTTSTYPIPDMYIDNATATISF